MAREEDPNSADKKHRHHNNKAGPVDHPGNQEPLFILLGGWKNNWRLAPVLIDVEAWEDKSI